jgi:hypothetical protein
VRDSYIHETPQAVPGGGGYLFEICCSGASENLVENNIMWNGNKVVVMQASGGGNVVAYNYMDDAWGATYPSQPEAGANAGHYTTPHMELLEGNYTHKYDADSYWGNSIDITVFRNWLSGLRAGWGWLATYTSGGYPYADYGGLTGRNAVDILAYNYRQNLVGNVLGMAGQTLLPLYNKGGVTLGAQAAFAFETLNNTAGWPGNLGLVSMWVIGADQADQRLNSNGSWNWVANTYQTQLRDGNWDWVTKTQTWLGIGGTQSNPLGTPKSIPNSLYLTSRPAFFGSNTWPWVDPSTGTTYVLPAKARFDAGTPNSVQ